MLKEARITENSPGSLKILGWLEVSPTHLASLGEFGKLPATLGASNFGLNSLQVCLLYNPAKKTD
jgi:hypothetical protein